MKLGQGNIFTGVCYSVHKGVCLSACWGTTPPPRPGRYPQDQAGPPGPGRHPPGARNPPGPVTPPPEQSIMGDTVNDQAVCILLECNLFLLVIYTSEYIFHIKNSHRHPY